MLLVLALAGLNLLRPTREQFVVFAVDRSLSVGDEGRKAADEFLARATAGGRAEPVRRAPFAAEPGDIRLGEAGRGSRAPPGRSDDPPGLDPKGTDLAAALEVAAAAIPPFYVPRIVLLSDGNSTAGDALKAAAGAAGQGRGLDRRRCRPRTEPEVQLSAVNAPTQVQQGEPFNVEVVVDSNHDDDAGTVEVYRGDIKVADQPVKLKKGENRVILKQTIEQGGLTPITARLEGIPRHPAGQQQRLRPGLHRGQAAGAPGRERARPGQAPDLGPRGAEHAGRRPPPAGDAREPGRAPELRPADPLERAGDVAEPMRQMEVARTYVQDLGGGLIMLGGDQSFGLGGYYKTTLEEILPVRSDFEKEKEKPSLAMMLVIDKSGSMGGEKIEMAKDAARAAVELLGPERQGRRARLRGGELLGQRAAPLHRQGVRPRPDRLARGRRRDRHGPGDGGGVRGPDRARWPSSST